MLGKLLGHQEGPGLGVSIPDPSLQSLIDAFLGSLQGCGGVSAEGLHQLVELKP